MNCKACGYDDHGDPATHYLSGTVFKPFIELESTPVISPEIKQGSPAFLATRAKYPGHGVINLEARVFACPQCGTLKIDVARV